jgi:hypothetical protein
MTINNRDVDLGGVFAANATTNIPTPPVPMQSYRSGQSLLQLAIANGWAFTAIVNSADFNEFLYRLSFLTAMNEQQGILSWSPNTTYVGRGLVLGSDGIVYRSQQDGNIGNDPTTDTTQTWWINVDYDSIMATIDDLIKGQAPVVGSFWFGFTGNTPFTVPNPTSTAQNYFDFTTHTPYTAMSNLAGWVAGTPIVPPTDHDARILITSRFWDIVESTNTGGVAVWSSTNSSWAYVPTIISWANVQLTGVPTAPTAAAGTNTTQLATTAFVTAAINAALSTSAVPVGCVLFDMVTSGGATAAGYLNASGQNVSRTTYSALFNRLGVSYGAGDGSTTFTLPNINAQGAFLRGRGGNANTTGNMYQDSAAPNITGSYRIAGCALDARKDNNPVTFAGAFSSLYRGSTNGSTTFGGGTGEEGFQFNAQSANAAYGRSGVEGSTTRAATEIRPRNYSAWAIIKT